MQRTVHLTAPEVRRLTLLKWTYRLREAGFTKAQVRRLVFARYLLARGRIGS